ncbi:hypothetical protein ONV78_08135 [Hahella sp. CR1]|uniref:hypothetical protein n=1 Tax=Hahella sp. CR1 TaxID=2992807 RepID=UPI0024412786|nr:hypothetical protein [Hahella sp. CR1]MDG9667695.1 hypothetical protein [Hahella sp. CR1]
MKKVKHLYKESFITWFLFDYLLPVLFIIGFWLVAALLIKMPYAFERVLSTADLMPIASILMLSVFREIDAEIKLNRVPEKITITVQKNLAIFFPIVILCVYCIAKYYTMNYTFPTENGKEIDNIIKAIPYASFISIIFSGIFCFSAKWAIISSLKAE